MRRISTGIAALFLGTGAAHAGDIPDGTMPLKIPPGFDESFPPLGYPRFCICMGEEPNGSRFMYPTYCVLDIRLGRVLINRDGDSDVIKCPL
jgi:hypothetical protein